MRKPLFVPSGLPKFPAAAALLAAAALAAPAAAQVDLFEWSLVEQPSFPSTTFFVSGDSLTVNGPFYPDPCFAPGADGYAFAIAPFDATVSVRMAFLPDDPAGFDMPMYVVNGVKHLLTEDCDDCEIVFHVQAGDSFGFGNHSKDCLILGAVSVWSELRLLPEPAAASVSGGSPAGAFGQAVANLGDLDFDGVHDVAVGAPHSFFGGGDSGRVVVLSGADGSLLFAVDGEAGGFQFGAAVAGVGDINGDLVPDLLVGAPHASVAAPAAGRFYVLSGAGGAVLVARDGPGPGALFGAAVAGTGDVDGDGVPDLLVGAPGAFAAGVGAGRAVLFSGATGGLLLSIAGAAPGDHCGAALAGVDDVDGDGRRDLLVASPLAAPGGLAQAGVVRVHSGASGSVLLTLAGTAAHDQLGAAVAGLGDLDADGVPEIAVGAPYADGALANVGRVTVHSGASGALLLAATGSAAGDALGWSVAAAGDVDADGVPDVLAGALGSGGSDPGAAGTARVLSGRDGSVIALFGGAAAGDQWGAAVAAAGDVDRDGAADVLVGAPGSDGPLQDAGRVTAYSGIHVIWADLGGGLPGTAGTPALDGTGLLVAGGPLALDVSGSYPHGPTTLVIGLTPLGIPFKGGVLVPSPDVVLSGLLIGAGGGLSLAATWPPGIPAGTALYLQAWILDPAAPEGFAATNGLRGLTP